MKLQKYFGLNGHGEQLPFEGYIIEEGLFAVRQDLEAPTYQRWKIDHLPSGFYASYAPTRKDAIRLTKQAMQAAETNSINLNFKSMSELSSEHRQILKIALER